MPPLSPNIHDNKLNTHDKAIEVIKHITEAGGLKLTSDDLTILNSPASTIENNSIHTTGIYNAMLKGFFECATTGRTFCAEQKIIDKFGNSISDNYPEASSSFLKFANTYWTLKIIIYDITEEKLDWIGGHLLRNLEQIIGPVFFPFPGPSKIAPDKREHTQRALLAELAPNMDVEEFITGNPILLRDKMDIQRKNKSMLRRLMKPASIFFAALKYPLVKLFPGFTYKGVVHTQIAIYKRLKKKFPETEENDILNSLIISRIRTPFGDTPPDQTYACYESLLQKKDKTLEDVVSFIVNYEYFDNTVRQTLVYKEGIPHEIVEKTRQEYMAYVKKYCTSIACD